MSSSKSSQRLPHAWVLYVAALAPTLAIVLAFSLGPSPRKQLAELNEVSPERAAAILESLEDSGLSAVMEAAARPGAHRALLIDHLGRHGHAPAAPLLDELSHDVEAPSAVQKAALDALRRIEAPSPTAHMQAVDEENDRS